MIIIAAAANIIITHHRYQVTALHGIIPSPFQPGKEKKRKKVAGGGRRGKGLLSGAFLGYCKTSSSSSSIT